MSKDPITDRSTSVALGQECDEKMNKKLGRKIEVTQEIAAPILH